MIRPNDNLIIEKVTKIEGVNLPWNKYIRDEFIGAGSGSVHKVLYRTGTWLAIK
jgi:hypothetical protein